MTKEYDGAEDINDARRALTALEMALMPEGQHFEPDGASVNSAWGNLNKAIRRLSGPVRTALYGPTCDA